VERYTRGEDVSAAWVPTEADRLDLSIELASIGCTLALRDVYEHVDLPPRPLLRAVYERPAGVLGAGYLAEAL
jgi:hypothetical protein